MCRGGAGAKWESLDYKPKLFEENTKPCPAELLKGEGFAFIRGVPKLLGTPHSFARHGRSGQEISNLLPHLAGIADEIAIVRSMQTEQFNHAPAQIYMNSGHPLPGRPSMGAWMTYGLGTDDSDLTGFLVLISGGSYP